MGELFKKGLINLPTEEELLAIQQRNYENNQQNPNTFSYWFAALSGALQKEFLVPTSVCLELPFALKKALEKDMHKVSDETKEAFKQFIFENESVKTLQATSKALFMKSGVFSNKFDFDASCKLLEEQQIFEHFYNILYVAALYGANHTNEIVLREYIEDVEQRDTIYNGMPLRTEFRVFFDFDTDQLLGIANYWHPEEMRQALVPHSVRQIFAKTPDIAEQKKLAKDLVRKLNSEKLKVEFDAYFTHLEQLVDIEREYHALKTQITAKVDQALKGTKVLEGAWSIDIMKNGDDFYFIDAARMNESALVNRMELI